MTGLAQRPGRVAVVVLLVLLATCSRDQPTGPDFAIQDGAHENGNSNFFFLPPLVSNPSQDPDFDPDGFDASVQPTVVICLLAASDCGTQQPAGFPLQFTTISGPGSEQIRVDAAAQHYIVNWHAGDYQLDPASTYRIHVLVAGTLLGYADVDVVSDGRELRSVSTNEYIGLVAGRTLPIKFRIERGGVVSIEVRESIIVRDQTEVLQPVVVAVTEAITVSDHTVFLPSVSVSVTEDIRVAEVVKVILPAAVSVTEGITVADILRVLPPAAVAVTEPIVVADRPLVLPPIELELAEAVTVADLVKVIPPAAVSVRETVVIADRTAILPPIEISIRESIGVTDAVAVIYQ